MAKYQREKEYTVDEKGQPVDQRFLKNEQAYHFLRNLAIGIPFWLVPAMLIIVVCIYLVYGLTGYGRRDADCSACLLR